MLKRFIHILICVLLGSYALLLLLSNFSPMQQWLTKEVSQALSKKLQTKVGIGEVQIGLFNRVVLHNVSINDRAGESILRGKLLSCKVELMPLLYGKVSLRSVSLIDTHINLYKTSHEATPNYDFILQAFKSNDEKSATKLDLRINSIIMRRCNLSHVVRSEQETPGVFNRHIVRIRDIDANVSLKHLTTDSLCLRVRKLSFKEQCGFQVNALRFQIDANRKMACISRFLLELPHSRIAQKVLTARYDFTNTTDSVSQLRAMQFNANISNWEIGICDFTHLNKQLLGFNYHTNLSTDLQIAHNDLKLTNLHLTTEKNELRLLADVHLAYTDSNKPNFSCNVRDFTIANPLLQDVIQRVTNHRIPLPLAAITLLSLQGKSSYYGDGNGTLQMHTHTNLGDVETNLKLEDNQLDGYLAVHEFSPAKLMSNNVLPDNLSAKAEMSLLLQPNKIPEGKMLCHIPTLSYRGYEYQNLLVKASNNNRKFEATVDSKDPNADLSAKMTSSLNKGKLSDIRFSTSVNSFRPQSLNLTSHFGTASLQMQANVQLEELPSTQSMDQLHGIVQIKDFSVCDTDTFTLQSMQLLATPSTMGTRMHLKADFGTALFDGPLSYAQLQKATQTILAEKLPQFVPTPSQSVLGNWKTSVQLSNTDFIPAILRIPLSFPSGLFIEGGVQSDNHRMLLSAKTDSVIYNNNVLLYAPTLLLKNDEQQLSMLFKTQRKIARSNMHIEMDVATDSGNIHTNIQWKDLHSPKNHGALLAKLSKNEQDELITELYPTDIYIDDTLWHVSSGKIGVKAPVVKVDKFNIVGKRGGIAIDGNLSSLPTDTLHAHLRNVDVDYILKLFNINPVTFAGLASGHASIHAALPDSIVAQANLNIPQFHFNHALLGDADIRMTFNTGNGRIQFDGTRIEEQGRGHTIVNGYVSPAEKGLDLRVQSQQTNLAFLNKYVSGILDDIEGRTSGTTRIYGPFKKIDFEGIQHPQMSATLPATNVRYMLNKGRVKLTSGRFSFDTISVSDAESHSALLNGYMKHTHLKQINYQFNLTEANNLLLYNRGRSIDMPFYATVYGSGNMSLNGSPGILQVDASVTPNQNTVFVYTVDNPTASTDNRLLRILQPQTGNNASNSSQTTSPSAPSSSRTHLLFNFDINMQPEATLRVITNARSGDHLDLYTSGNILATFDSKGDFTIHHPLTVEGGIYQLNIQNVINKRLNFKPGGKIHFNGNPFEANLELEAMYTVPSVSLSDLNIGSRLSTATTPVNCLFLFSGTAGSPQIDFGFELPNASDEVEQMVQDLIATEDDKRMQALYLLGIGRFYTYDYASTEAAENQSQTSVAMKSFLSSTLSSQLNNILQSAIPSANWTFGANFATGNVGWSDMEIEGILSGRLFSGRLLLNGNFGYRENPTNYSTTHFMGDFDIEYLLTPSGNVSLRGYSKTNDRYFSPSSLTTQGIGLQLKRQFNTLPQLFKPNRKNNTTNKKRTKK